MPPPPRNFEEYLDLQPSSNRAALEKLRDTIRKLVPDAEERISYRIPIFYRDGMLVGFGATRNHCAFYLLSKTTVAEHAEDLKDYDTSMGTIRFPPNKPLPTALVRKLVKARLAENQELRALKPRKKASR